MTSKTIPIYLPLTLKVTQEQFQEIAAANRDLRLERTATGKLIIMPPTGGNTGRKNLYLGHQIYSWNEQKNLGVAFDSSTAFHLPNGADLSPDIAWVNRDRWESLTLQEQDRFPPVCPDFVIELRSKTDIFKELQQKMPEYLDNGLKLGWLIDVKNRRVEIYRPARPVEVLQSPDYLSGEDVLPGLRLDLTNIFE